MIMNDVEKEFQVVFDAIDTCAEHIKTLLKAAVSQRMNEVIEEVNKFELQMKERIKVFDPEALRSECITFLRDYGVKESYKGTEFLIYILLNHRSTENLKLSALVKEIASVYKTPEHSIRANLNRALEYIDNDFITAKESLYTMLREWEIYKKDKELK